ncbi:MAG TPA: metal-dependent hydrolase [Pyrinomonadaceae bacterium]|nr:metal-dependent hydrolase [Pyrinomonadaceae bacterium]
MATIFSHAAAAVALGKVYEGGRTRPRFWWLAAACSIIPDFDTFGLIFGIRYGDTLGHRGFTHSLLFALLAGLLVASAYFRDVPRLSGRWWRLVLFFFAATASHGVLDALTNGGLGVAFFSPFDTRRYFLPWRPVEVSPIGLGFFGPQGLSVIRSEIVWIWAPSLVLVAAAWVWRRVFGDSSRGRR